jgi:hypothetical protein
LLWGTGREELWTVEAIAGFLTTPAHRILEGPITASGGRLLLTNYEWLSRAAQFRDVRLGEGRQSSNIIEVEPGEYVCQVAQTQDPGADDDETEGGLPHFRIQLQPALVSRAAWSSVPWRE